MIYFVVLLIGFGGGAFCTFIAFDIRRRRLNEQKADQDAQTERIRTAQGVLRDKEVHLQQQVKQRQEQIAQHAASVKAELETLRAQAVQEAKAREHQVVAAAASEKAEIAKRVAELDAATAKFNGQVITYQDLQQENVVIKRDLANLAVNTRKLHLDGELSRVEQESIQRKVSELGGKYLKENVKWIGNSLNANNFANCKQRLVAVIQRCREVGFAISQEEEAAYIAELRNDYEKVVRSALEREEQARIKAVIREEQQREREIQRELEKIERERAVIAAALARALAETQDEHSAEIESLKARLAQAEANQRAVSQAQLTKAGHIYVISNIGSFGEGVYKIGMTRRLDPLERVRELGDASVPFPFDVHMVISCENAPALENALHRKLFKQQVNRTNPRKEFFKTDILNIVEVVKEHHGEVEYIADAEALQYHQSLNMSEDDHKFIEHTFDEAEEDLNISSEDPSLPVKA